MARSGKIYWTSSKLPFPPFSGYPLNFTGATLRPGPSHTSRPPCPSRHTRLRACTPTSFLCVRIYKHVCPVPVRPNRKPNFQLCRHTSVKPPHARLLHQHSRLCLRTFAATSTPRPLPPYLRACILAGSRVTPSTNSGSFTPPDFCASCYHAYSGPSRPSS